VADAVHRQQHVLHHVVHAARRHALPARDGLDDRHAVAQQGRVGGAVAGLGRRHPGRPPPVGLLAGIAARRSRHRPPSRPVVAEDGAA
jgi:hypothetical protein